MKHLVLWFVKITGILPFLIWYKPHKYYESERNTDFWGEILVANHTTLMDFPMMLFTCPLRTVRVLMAEVLFRSPLSAWFMKQLGGIRVNRDAPENTDKLQEAISSLTEGGIVGIFPEGRLNKDGRNYGSLLPFNSGAAYLALRTGAKIRPMYFNMRGGLFRSSGMLIGDPVDLRAMFGTSTNRENLVAATKYLRQKVEQLREELKFKSEHRENSLMTRFVKWSTGLGMKIGFRYRVHFEDPSLKDRILSETCIVACNHTSVFDPPLLCTVFHQSRIHILAAESLYRYRFLGRLLNRLGCIRIDRNILDVESFHLMQSVLARGESVGIFPEGKLSATGELGEFKPGTMLAAFTTDVDVIPVYMSGEARLFSRSGREIWIGVPLQLTGAMTSGNIQCGTEMLLNAVRHLEQLSKE